MGRGEDPWTEPDRKKSITSIIAELTDFYVPTFCVKLYGSVGVQDAFVVVSDHALFIPHIITAIDEYFGGDDPRAKGWENVDWSGNSTRFWRNALLDLFYFHNVNKHSSTIWLDQNPNPVSLAAVFAGDIGENARNFTEGLPRGNVDATRPFNSG